VRPQNSGNFVCLRVQPFRRSNDRADALLDRSGQIAHASTMDGTTFLTTALSGKMN
jgi:hypothetical protein